MKTPHLAGVTKHLRITKQIHISSSYSVYSAKCTNVGYTSASVNIVKISLLIVSRQRHSSWNRSHAAALNALDVVQLGVKTASDDYLNDRQGSE